MIKIYKKNIKNKPFFYLTEQVNVGRKFKKIQVYLGKDMPNDLGDFYDELEKKEKDLILDNLKKIFKLNKDVDLNQVEKVENSRIDQKYFFARLSDSKKEKFWRKFAVEFIFQSNSIEGSKLSQGEVEKIINKKYIKKTLDKKEVIEAENSIKAFDFIQSSDFMLNQKNIKKLHSILTKDLNIEQGYKTKKIVVNNKETISPDRVRVAIKNLLSDYQKNKSNKEHPFFLALKFHSHFEFIHPFEDGNGRVGRMILIWMLQKNGYGPILFKLQNRNKYFSALNSADEGRLKKLYWFAVGVYEKTVRDCCKFL